MNKVWLILSTGWAVVGKGSNGVITLAVSGTGTGTSITRDQEPE